jgi:hypothetical protein
VSLRRRRCIQQPRVSTLCGRHPGSRRRNPDNRHTSRTHPNENAHRSGRDTSQKFRSFRAPSSQLKPAHRRLWSNPRFPVPRRAGCSRSLTWNFGNLELGNYCQCVTGALVTQPKRRRLAGSVRCQDRFGPECVQPGGRRTIPQYSPRTDNSRYADRVGAPAPTSPSAPPPVLRGPLPVRASNRPTRIPNCPDPHIRDRPNRKTEGTGPEVSLRHVRGA